MHLIPDLRDTILNTWRTNNQVTVFLVEHVPLELWATAAPGAFRDVIRFTRPPQVVQAVLFGVLAPLAPLLGYQGSYAE